MVARRAPKQRCPQSCIPVRKDDGPLLAAPCTEWDTDKAANRGLVPTVVLRKPTVQAAGAVRAGDLAQAIAMVKIPRIGFGIPAAAVAPCKVQKRPYQHDLHQYLAKCQENAPRLIQKLAA
jgi:hypothetical protein